MGLFNFNKKSKKRSEWPSSNGLTETQKRNIDKWADQIHNQAMAEGRDEVEIFGEQLERLGIVKRRNQSNKPPVQPKANSYDSYVRGWTKRRTQELQQSNDITPEVLFVGAMGFVTMFAEQTEAHKAQALPFDAPTQYSGDASLFELGCYVYIRIDMWLAMNKPHLRTSISSVFIQEFDRLFSRALGVSNLKTIFNERVSKYGELARKGETPEQYHFYLCELISRTKDNKLPKHYEWDHEPLNLSATDTFGIKSELLRWEKIVLPLLIEAIGEFTSLMKQR